MPKQSTLNIAENTNDPKPTGINKYLNLNFIQYKLMKQRLKLRLKNFWRLLKSLWNFSSENAIKYMNSKPGDKPFVLYNEYLRFLLEQKGRKIKRRRTNKKTINTSQFELVPETKSTSLPVKKNDFKAPVTQSDKCILKGKEKSKNVKKADKKNTTVISQFKLGSETTSTSLAVKKNDFKAPVTQSDKCILKGNEKSKNVKKADKKNTTVISQFKLGPETASTSFPVKKNDFKAPVTQSDKCILKGKEKSKNVKKADKKNTTVISQFKLGSETTSTSLAVKKNDFKAPVTQSDKCILKGNEKSKNVKKADKKNTTVISQFKLGPETASRSFPVKKNDFKAPVTQSDKCILKGNEKSKSVKKTDKKNTTVISQLKLESETASTSLAVKKNDLKAPVTQYEKFVLAEDSFNCTTRPRIKLETMAFIDPLDIPLEFQKRK